MNKITLFALLVLSSFTAMAQPEYYNETSGTNSNVYPLSSASNRKAQWIIGPNKLRTSGTTGTVPPAGNISKIFLRMGNAVNAASQYNGFTISLSQNVGTDTTFGSVPESAYNFVTGMTQCFYQATGFQFTGVAVDSWYGIQLQTSFPYNPALSLVIEIKATSGTGNRLRLSDGNFPQRLYGTNASAAATNANGMLNVGVNWIASPLPALVTNFDGKQDADIDVLQWETTSEKNNAFFNVQHSTNGIDFNTIAKVHSKADNGNSNTRLAYSAIYNNPIIGTNYYRLQQVDLDGKSSIETKTIQLSRKNNSMGTRVYPNPATNVLHVDYYTNNQSNVSYQILDMQGRLVKSKFTKAMQGKNTVEMNISDLPSGNYEVIVLENNQKVHQEKLSK